MKDSKKKEYRISNLKNMMDTVKDEEDDSELENIEEDSELIEYLNEDTDYSELEIDDEYIYRPGDDDSDTVNLEENPIDEDYIIKAPKTEDSEDNSKYDTEEFDDELTGDINENFDNVIHAKVRGHSILAIVSSILGVIFLIISVYIFQSRSDRIIDNVVAGETNFMFVIFFIVGLFLLLYGIYKLFNIKNPFENITKSIDSIENNNKSNTKKETPKPHKKEPSPKIIPKSNIPLDKEAYKIGEFAVDGLKPTSKKNSTDKKSDDDLPQDEELSEKEIEEMEYEKAKLESESIDDIVAEVEDIEDIPIISVDSKEEKDK